jgi:hypothetical protein
MATDFVDEDDDPHARAPIEGGEPRLRILLVDDDPATLLMMEQVDTAGSKARFSGIPKGSDPTELREQLISFHHRDAFAAPPQDPVSRPG